MRREVPLTPRHAASFNAMWEAESWGRVGVEAYYTGPPGARGQSLPVDAAAATCCSARSSSGGSAALRLFLNVENLVDVRQTKDDPLVLPARLPDGRWTVDAWAPLDGRVLNGGVRVAF